MIIDFKFASLVISLFCHLLSPPFILGMAYTRRTLQLEERIYVVQNYEKLWPIVSKRDDCADLNFQQDGATAHYAVSIRKWLDEHFPDRWIGHRGFVEWPARSPDLTPRRLLSLGSTQKSSVQ